MDVVYLLYSTLENLANQPAEISGRSKSTLHNDEDVLTLDRFATQRYQTTTRTPSQADWMLNPSLNGVLLQGGSRLANNLHKVRLQASSPNKRTIDIWVCNELADVFRRDAPTIENTQCLSSLIAV
jgi:hypothetical protein